MSPVTIAFAITLVFASFVLSLDSSAAQFQPTPPRSLDCKALLQTQNEGQKDSPNPRLIPVTIDLHVTIDLFLLLKEKKLPFINPTLLDLINQDPRNLQLIERLKRFDFQSPGASENLFLLLKDLREIAKKSNTWRERVFALKKNLLGPTPQELLDEASNLVATKEFIDDYLKKELDSPTESRLRTRLSRFIHGAFLTLKPIAIASVVTWLLGFPTWLHRSHTLEDLNGDSLMDTKSLKMNRNQWIDVTTDKLFRLTLVAMVLFKSTVWALDIEGNFSDFAEREWANLNTALIVTEAYATYDAEKPGRDPAPLAQTMKKPEYTKWAAEYEKEYNKKPDPDNIPVDLFLWQTSPEFTKLRQTSPQS